MTHQDRDNQSEDEQISDPKTMREPQAEESEVKKAVPAWIISMVVHAVVLGLLSMIVYATQEIAEEPPIKTTALPVPPKEEEKIVRDVKEVELPLDVEVESDTPSPVSQLDVPVEEFASEEENDATVPKGREEATANSEAGGNGAFMAVGAGGGASGMFGSRSGGGKKRALGRFGGSKGSESAVDAALRWFKRHQSPNGQWDIDGYPANCTEAPKCEPGTANTDIAGDVAGTSYAILCFLGAGYDHRMPSKYKATVKKGLDWLISIQEPGGSFGGFQNYALGIGTMALAEAYAMSNDSALKEPAQKAVNFLLSHQTPDNKNSGYGLGWDYWSPNPERMDSSVSGWCVMALKSAAAGGLSIGNGMEGAKNYLERAWKACNPNFKPVNPYTDESCFPYTFNEVTEKTESNHLAPVGALLAVFLGHKADDPMLNSMANYIMTHHFVEKYPCNVYYMYYDTLAIFQIGGDRWEKWNKTCRDVLVNAQRKADGCFDGSWDWMDTEYTGFATGRILSTAYCCLSLEVYYRYLPVGAKH